MYIGEQRQDPPEDVDPLENCAECSKKLEGEDQQWFCSKECEKKHIDAMKADDDAYARSLLEDMELAKSFGFMGRL